MRNSPTGFKDAYGLYAQCTAVAEQQLTPWIPTADVISATPYTFKDFSEIDDKGIAVIRCRWERTVTEALWGHALFAVEYHCTVTLPCGAPLFEYTYYGFDWREQYEGTRQNLDWFGTSYTTLPWDDGDFTYAFLCVTKANPNP